MCVALMHHTESRQQAMAVVASTSNQPMTNVDMVLMRTFKRSWDWRNEFKTCFITFFVMTCHMKETQGLIRKKRKYVNVSLI